MLKALLLNSCLLTFPLVCAATEVTIIPSEKPNGCLLIFAHGYRPEGFPSPASIDSAGLACRTLHEQGWMLAATSFRRTGLVVEDGADDIDALRDQIEKQSGPIQRCLLLGESMGGTIVTLLAARDAQRYQGGIAIGAALDLLPAGPPSTTSPKIPLLFLTNQSELPGSEKYVSRFQSGAKNLALWKVARDGHCNVNQAETLAALQAINLALDGTPLTDRDATIAPSPGKSRAIVTGEGIKVAVQEIDPVFGNFVVAAQLSDLAKLGLRRGDRFLIRAGREQREVLLGKEFNDVPEGGWVAFENADGWLRIARNFRNAAQNLHLDQSSFLSISAK